MPETTNPTFTMQSNSGSNSWVVPVVIIGMIGLVGFLVYTESKTVSKIAEKEGSGGVLKYEAGRAAIGLAADALSPRRKYDRNKSKKRAKRRR